MPTRVLDSQTVVQVLGPSLATESLFVTFRSYPSGSVLLKTIPTTVFEAGDGGPLIRGLGDAVESILTEGVAIAAAGTQGVDKSGLIFDAVTFTVEYVPPVEIPGQITGNVQINVLIITADTSLLGGGGVESASQLIADERDRLAAMSGY